MVFAETFGQTGTAVTFFGGQWWLVGIYLLIIFITFLLAYRVTAYGITTFIIMGLLSVGAYQIFVIGEQVTQTILFMLFIFIGFVAYIFFSK